MNTQKILQLIKALEAKLLKTNSLKSKIKTFVFVLMDIYKPKYIHIYH